MDRDQEEELNKIFECVRKQIPYGILDRIVEAQEQFHNGLEGNHDGPYNKENGLWRNGKRLSESKNVGTMTDRRQIPEDPVSSGENETKMTTAEKQAAKKRLAEEKREMQLANKMYKPGECMKHMTVELHPTLASAWYAADIAREVTATSAKLRVSGALCSPALVLWSRGTAPTLTTESGVLELAPTHHKCARALYVTTADEVSEYVAAKNLSQTIDNMRQLTGCEVTLVVFGVDDYFKPSGRKRNNQRVQMTEIELEMALTDLLVTAGCDTVKVDTPNELALTVVHFTKAIAEAPYKQAKRQCDEQSQFYMRGDNKNCVAVSKNDLLVTAGCDTVKVDTPNELALTVVHFTKAIAEAPYKQAKRQCDEQSQFYMRGDNKNCVAVSKNGAGLSKLWQQMLAILPMSSLERSRALCAKYSSPKRLYEELQSSSGVGTIADIGVPRSAVPGSVARRTGGEFARKLQILFTADDGDAVVQ